MFSVCVCAHACTHSGKLVKVLFDYLGSQTRQQAPHLRTHLTSPKLLLKMSICLTFTFQDLSRLLADQLRIYTKEPYFLWEIVPCLYCFMIFLRNLRVCLIPITHNTRINFVEYKYLPLLLKKLMSKVSINSYKTTQNTTKLITSEIINYQYKIFR